MGVVGETLRGMTGCASAEDRVTSTIEGQTTKIPSTLFLAAGLAVIGTSLALELSGRRNWSRFVGVLAPTILIMGLYNKVVKQHGH